MRIIRGADEARSTLLRRAPLDERQLPPTAQDLIRRVFGAELGPGDVVDRILRDVRESGDAAVRRYNEEIDGVTSEASKQPLEVSRDEIKQARTAIDESLVDALTLAADRIRTFHERQLAHSLKSFQDGPVGQVVRPVARAGFYVPGTAAIYPSTVLMSVIPARVAGVTEVIMATPVAPDGSVAPLKLVAADIAGVNRVFRAGGVQGIAAMAYGTETVPRVDKISGPGGIFVTLAKKKLFGEVGIDGIFGPSETLVVADASANPALVAADLLAGAEHDELATAILFTDSVDLAEAVSKAVGEGLSALDRASIARESLEARGGIILTDSIGEVHPPRERVRPRAPLPPPRDRRPRDATRHERRLRLCRRALRRVDRRLHRRPQPRHADRRQRRLRLAARRAGLPEGDERRTPRPENR